MRIQIIGYSGAGKSTLAAMLGDHYQIPVLHLDNTKFYGDWQERTQVEQSIIVDEFLAKNENWIIDGNYSNVAESRFSLCDMCIFLDYNRFYCYRKCRERYFEYRHKHRSSCPCKEKFDWEFKKWLLFSGRTKKRKQKHLNNLNKCPGKKLHFKNKTELNEFLKELEIGKNQ